MYYHNTCKQDCVHRENGICKYNYHLQNSIFPLEKTPCLYYAAKKKDIDIFPKGTELF